MMHYSKQTKKTDIYMFILWRTYEYIKKSDQMENYVPQV